MAVADLPGARRGMHNRLLSRVERLPYSHPSDLLRSGEKRGNLPAPRGAHCGLSLTRGPIPSPQKASAGGSASLRSGQEILVLTSRL